MIRKKLLKKVREYCSIVMNEGRCSTLPFHNWEHTLDVVHYAKHIAQGEGLSEASIFELTIAAYFHDLGNEQGAAGHEALSCKYAYNFLKKEGCNMEQINAVIKLIKATEISKKPTTVEEQVLCDADLIHLGTENFSTKNAKLRKEWATFGDARYTDDEWLAKNITFLKEHSFYTTYAKEKFSPQKIKNLNMLKVQADQKRRALAE
ncbi:HD domain-containing protein [Cochleicola gelatinilyticus]|uniref:HD/PDEase domain-containing protein n=1 Tax=Cochleicola gelatinilyticus TaxID=1763537 RepID=A0A167HIM0_9FLAO|nr:HD domain-containing protein [Cochleicola gelatinilyticus]OAB78652.1 hypothetical protein ULVI_08700 [Cochleicola gelatinilyticus]